MSSRNPIGDFITGLGKVIKDVGEDINQVKHHSVINPIPTVRLFESAEDSRFTIVVEFDDAIDPKLLDELGVKAYKLVKSNIRIEEPAPVSPANTVTKA